MPFDQPAHQIAELPPAASPSAPQLPAGQAAKSFLVQSAALAIGLAASFLVLLGTRGVEIESEIFCNAGALVVIGLWLGTGAFRHDGAALRLRSAMWLVPIVAIQSGWWQIPRTGAALVIETFCIAMLFAATLQSLGAEFGNDLRRRMNARGRRP